MRGKQEGGENSPNPPEAWRGSHTARTPFTPQLWNSSCLYGCAQERLTAITAFSFFPSLPQLESHSMGNHEKGMKTSPPPPSYFLRKRNLPPALGEAMIVYFEWCAIMTVQQINVTQVCGKWWNFRVIPCKLLILSGESCNTEACSTSLTHSNLTVVLLCQNVWQPALL